MFLLWVAYYWAMATKAGMSKLAPMLITKIVFVQPSTPHTIARQCSVSLGLDCLRFLVCEWNWDGGLEVLHSLYYFFALLEVARMTYKRRAFPPRWCPRASSKQCLAGELGCDGICLMASCLCVRRWCVVKNDFVCEMLCLGESVFLWCEIVLLARGNLVLLIVLRNVGVTGECDSTDDFIIEQKLQDMQVCW
eukprot:SAG31_NODE_16128_length_722_cov_0.781701_1_plen_192_part_01